MTILKIITEPAILIITVFFLFFIMTVLKNYAYVEKNLNSVYNFLTAEQPLLQKEWCRFPRF